MQTSSSSSFLEKSKYQIIAILKCQTREDDVIVIASDTRRHISAGTQ